MPSHFRRSSIVRTLLSLAGLLALPALVGAQSPDSIQPAVESVPRLELAPGWKETRRLDSDYATQAAAADEKFVYAFSNPTIAKYERESGKLVAVSEGKATHLNAGAFVDGKLICANSNYPRRPESSQVMSLDPQTMKLTVMHDFGESEGSLVWVLRHDGRWWANFAFYKEENGKSYLAKFDDEWNELQRWTYPKELLAHLREASLSGGIWRDGALLATGHDDKILFRLNVPADGKTLELLGAEKVPFTGQGFADDPLTGGLIGIDRAKRQIVFAEAAE